MDDEGTFPLGFGDIHGADRAFWWDRLFDASEVGLLAGEGHAGTGIETVLYHLKSVIEEEFSEIDVAFPFLLGFDRKVECDH